MEISSQRETVLFLMKPKKVYNKLIKQKLKISTITKSEFEIGYNNPWLND